jgi:hypothetical protein
MTITSIVTSALLLVAGCGPIELESQWRDVDVAIDGVNTEWDSNTVYIEDPGVVVGMSNDDDFVYLCLMTSNRKVQKQVMASGFIVWLDSENNKNRDFGIRFPLGVQGAGSSPPDTESPRNVDSELADFNKIFEEHLATNDEFEIIGPVGMGVRRLQASEAQGVEVKIGFLRGGLVYELKVPIGNRNADHFYTVDSKPGGTIGVCLESPEIEPGELRGRGGGMGRGPGAPPGGGRGGMGGGGKFGGRGGGPGGPRPEKSFERPESFVIWVTVQLAAGT